MFVCVCVCLFHSVWCVRVVRVFVRVFVRVVAVVCSVCVVEVVLSAAEQGGGRRSAKGGAREGRGGWVSGVGRSDGGGRAREQAAAARESRLQEGAQLQGRRVKRAEAAGGDF